MATYTQTRGSEDGSKYFQDVEQSPVTLKDGTLRERFNTLMYPKTGEKYATIALARAAASD